MVGGFDAVARGTSCLDFNFLFPLMRASISGIRGGQLSVADLLIIADAHVPSSDGLN